MNVAAFGIIQSMHSTSLWFEAKHSGDSHELANPEGCRSAFWL
jgi:hypothetical protein